MAYYRVCPDCGCNLDPGEKCDCKKERERKQDFFRSHLKIEPGAGQLAFAFDSREGSYESKNAV